MLIKSLQSVYDKLDIGIIVLDKDLSIQYMNQWIKRRLPQDNSQPENLRELFQEHKYSVIESLVKNTIKNKSFRVLSQVFHSRVIPLPDKRFSDGLMRQGCSIMPFASPFSKETYALLQIRDDSDRVLQIKQLKKEKKITEEFNKQLQKAKEDAENANRTKSEFLANISHEIRTPLNAVIGFGELLTDLVSDIKQKSYLESIKIAGKSLLTLINDILDLSKIEAGRVEIQYPSIDLRMIFREIEQIFKMRIEEKKLKLIMEIDEDLPSALLLDGIRLRQILLNLVGNAVKFTEKGHIKLTAKKIGLKDEPESINLVISVEDTGIGIPKKEWEDIFESFKQQPGQSSEVYGGTGLGLSISKRLTELMNGKIEVTSVQNQGSVFKIVLRDVSISFVEPIIKDMNVFNLGNTTFETATILVVDDIKSNHTFLEEFLSRLNLNTVTAKNGLEAISQVNKCQPDLILMDIKMPVMDGIEATKQLKQNPKTKSIPVIALTALAETKDKNRLIDAGVDGYLTKPVKIPNLIKELSLFLKHEKKGHDAEDILNQNSRSTNISKGIIKNLPALLDKLIYEKSPLAETYLDSVLNMTEVKQFGNDLKQLAETHNAEILVDYSNNLLGFIESFDIKGIHTAIKNLPDLIESIKRLK